MLSINPFNVVCNIINILLLVWLMKKFLFDTWYGALTVWCGASALLVAMFLLDLPFAGRIWWSSIAPYVGFTLLLLLLIAGIVFIAA